ncbi:hypothetical protein H0I76_12180 [Limibaculum sp. M0105]|uniref:Secreted protein n=1 Tax=Thermohalobaculum xanthum TaxID=2753746 RepID=A0A8J7SHV7_9RHOB|nr:hypothetical protein [Thermohalobaculum xanthum]MBK0399950.1 hypothetical protein [Thermohalobaculum xanthum]
MVRLSAAFLFVLAFPLAAPGQDGTAQAPEPEPTAEQIAALEACLATVDEEAIDAFSEEMLERNSEITVAIDEACAAGQRSAAEALYAPLLAEYVGHPEVAKLRACLEVFDQALGVTRDEPHVCDDE